LFLAADVESAGPGSSCRYRTQPETTETLMIKPAAIALAAAAFAVSGVAPLIAQAQEGTPTMNVAASAPKKSGHVAANGLNYYYEIHGRGEPLLLLHGGLGSIDMFGPVLPAFAAGREVIAVDLHGHGRTELGDRPIDLIDIGDDLATVLSELGYGEVDVFGYSFGGGAGFRLAVQHPEMVRRLAIVSAGYSPSGYYDEIRAQQVQIGADMAEFMKETPMYASYVAVAPKPEDFPRLLQNMGDLMRLEFDWSEDAKTLQMPTMLIFGDSDMYKLDHVMRFYQLLGGGLKDAGWQREHMAQNRLAIIPNRTHYDIFFAPELVTTALPFLNGETAVKSWEEMVGEGQ
jgi:pimeloyl-ACP methyl ester carboxylesterase